MHQRRTPMLTSVLVGVMAGASLVALLTVTPSDTGGGDREAQTLRTELAATSARRIPPTFFGMFPTGITNAPISSSALAGTSAASGIGAVSLLDDGGDWTQVQAAAGAPFNFDALERSYANATSRGIKNVHLILIGTPRWAGSLAPTSAEPLPGYSSPPKSLALWDAYVTATVTHFKGRITSYQIWSEANLARLWRGSKAQLADMTRDAYRIIKKIDPRAAVVAPSTTVRMHDLATWFLPFARELGKRRWPIDAFSVHLYPAANGTPVTRQALFKEFKAYLALAKAPKKPIWDGEINYGVPGLHVKHVALDNALGAAYVARTYLDALRLGISRVYWSAWMPRNAVYGVTMWPGYTYGPRALRTTYGWLANKWWRGCGTSRTSTGTFVTCSVSSTTSASSFTARIVWSEGKTRAYRVPSGVTKLCLVSGYCVRTAAGRTIKVGQSPVWLGR
jgi:polysaccharide biosynthesis protein PslG